MKIEDVQTRFASNRNWSFPASPWTKFQLPANTIVPSDWLPVEKVPTYRDPVDQEPILDVEDCTDPFTESALEKVSLIVHHRFRSTWRGQAMYHSPSSQWKMDCPSARCVVVFIDD